MIKSPSCPEYTGRLLPISSLFEVWVISHELGYKLWTEQNWSRVSPSQLDAIREINPDFGTFIFALIQKFGKSNIMRPERKVSPYVDSRTTICRVKVSFAPTNPKPTKSKSRCWSRKNCSDVNLKSTSFIKPQLLEI